MKTEMKVLLKPDEILQALQQAQSWITNEEENVFWTGLEITYGAKLDSLDSISKPTEVLILQTEGNTLAYLEIHKNEFGWVRARHISNPQFRNQGFGTKLFDLGCERLFKRTPTLTAFREINNLKAMHLHLQFGFVLAGVHGSLLRQHLHKATYTKKKPLRVLNDRLKLKPTQLI